MENNLTPKQALEELQVEWEFNNKELPRGFVDTRYEIIEQALTELENLEEEVNDLNNSKELLLDKLDEQKQILKVLNKKKVNIMKLWFCSSAEEYNVDIPDWAQLTPDEFDLIKQEVGEPKYQTAG